MAPKKRNTVHQRLNKANEWAKETNARIAALEGRDSTWEHVDNPLAYVRGAYKRITALTKRVDHFSRRAYALRDLVQRIDTLEQRYERKIMLEAKEDLRPPVCHAPVDYARAEERVAAHVLRAQDEERQEQRKRRREASLDRAAGFGICAVVVLAVIGLFHVLVPVFGG